MEILYVFVATMWGVFAVFFNAIIHPGRSVIKHSICLIINVVGLPIALAIAAHNISTGKYDKYIKPTL